MDAGSGVFDGFGQAWQAYGLAAIVAVMLLKEIGLPIPVPGDVLMIGAGAAAALGALNLLGLLGAVTAAAIGGGWVQYQLARRLGRILLYRMGRFAGLTPERLDRASSAVAGRSWPAIAVVRFTPGLRIFCVMGCGLAAVPYSTFLPALVAGSLGFVGFHVLLGYFAGPPVISILESATVPIVTAVGALLAIGLGIWWIRGRRRGAAAAQAVSAWSEATCPVCLVIGRVPEGLGPLDPSSGDLQVRG